MIQQQNDNNINLGKKLAEQRNESDQRQLELDNNSPWNTSENKKENGDGQNV